MSLKNPEDQITREGLIARFYNAYSAGVETKEQALDLVAEIAQAVDGVRPKRASPTPEKSRAAGKRLAQAVSQ